MGTDHAIIIGWGYRIPIKVWKDFCQKSFEDWKEETTRYWKKRKTEPDYDPDNEGSCEDFDTIKRDWDKNYYTGINLIEEPETNDNFMFFQQGSYKEGGYVFICSKREFVHLMDRKIGGSTLGYFSQFEHMQNVNSLDFSVALDYSESMQDWKNDDGSWSEHTQEIKDFLNSLPELLRKFLEQFPTETYYNQWLFGYGC